MALKSGSDSMRLMEFSFYKRWEQVAVRPDLDELLNPPPLKGHEKSFSRIAASQRLYYLDNIKLPSQLPTAAPTEPELKPKPKPKKKKTLGSGDFVDVPVEIEDEPEVNPRGLPYDPLETVLVGQQDLHSEMGPEALLRQHRVAHFKQQNSPAVQRRILEKVDAMAPTPLLDASWSLAERHKRRMNMPQRLLALGELKTWLGRIGLDAAREELGFARGPLCRDDFVKALADRDYPYGILGAKTVAFFLSEDTISWNDITSCLEECEAPEGPSRWELLRNDAEEARRIRDQDPIEEHLIEQYVGTLRRRKDPNATHSDALAGLLKRMWQGEPEVAEFMEFVFTEFRSIPMLWRFLNISKKSLKGDDGVLTEEDFRTAMRCLFSREGRQPVEAHMSGLFDLLDTNKQNRIRLSDILHEEPHAGRGRKALLGRLRRFLEELTSSKTPEMKALMQLYKSPADAFKMSASGKVTRAGFIEGLRRLRYDEWHVDDLFTRIDRDGSGDITIEDILGFLKEAGPGGRYARPVPVHSNLLAKERTTGRLVPLNHCSIDASAKLSQLNDWFSDERLAQREVLKSARRPITSPKTTMLLSSASVPTLRKDLRRMGTTTRWQVRSQHSLSEIREPRELIYSYDPAPDLAPISCGLMDLVEPPGRRKVDHCLHS